MASFFIFNVPLCLACFSYLVSSITFEGSLIEAPAFPLHLSDTWCCSCTEYVVFHTSAAVTATIFSCACNGQLFTLSLRHVDTVSVLFQSPFHAIFKLSFQNIENSREVGALSTFYPLRLTSPVSAIMGSEPRIILSRVRFVLLNPATRFVLSAYVVKSWKHYFVATLCWLLWSCLMDCEIHTTVMRVVTLLSLVASVFIRVCFCQKGCDLPRMIDL